MLRTTVVGSQLAATVGGQEEEENVEGEEEVPLETEKAE